MNTHSFIICCITFMVVTAATPNDENSITTSLSTPSSIMPIATTASTMTAIEQQQQVLENENNMFETNENSTADSIEENVKIITDYMNVILKKENFIVVSVVFNLMFTLSSLVFCFVPKLRNLFYYPMFEKYFDNTIGLTLLQQRQHV